MKRILLCGIITLANLSIPVVAEAGHCSGGACRVVGKSKAVVGKSVKGPVRFVGRLLGR